MRKLLYILLQLSLILVLTSCSEKKAIELDGVYYDDVEMRQTVVNHNFQSEMKKIKLYICNTPAPYTKEEVLEITQKKDLALKSLYSKIIARYPRFNIKYGCEISSTEEKSVGFLEEYTPVPDGTSEPGKWDIIAMAPAFAAYGYSKIKQNSFFNKPDIKILLKEYKKQLNEFYMRPRKLLFENECIVKVEDIDITEWSENFFSKGYSRYINIEFLINEDRELELSPISQEKGKELMTGFTTKVDSSFIVNKVYTQSEFSVVYDVDRVLDPSHWLHMRNKAWVFQ